MTEVQFHDVEPRAKSRNRHQAEAAAQLEGSPALAVKCDDGRGERGGRGPHIRPVGQSLIAVEVGFTDELVGVSGTLKGDGPPGQRKDGLCDHESSIERREFLGQLRGQGRR